MVYKDGKGFYALLVTVENARYEYLFATETDALTAEKMIQYHGTCLDVTEVVKV